MSSGLDALFSVVLFALMMLVLWRPITRSVNKTIRSREQKNTDHGGQ